MSLFWTYSHLPWLRNIYRDVRNTWVWVDIRKLHRSQLFIWPWHRNLITANSLFTNSLVQKTEQDWPMGIWRRENIDLTRIFWFFKASLLSLTDINTAYSVISITILMALSTQPTSMIEILAANIWWFNRLSLVINENRSDASLW